MDQGRIEVIISDAELLPHVYPVDFLPQGPVDRVVEIQAADEILPALRVGVSPGHRPEPRPDRKQIGVADLMLPFMPVIQCFSFLSANLLSDHIAQYSAEN